MRSFDNYSPLPEEINRRIIGLVATYHFAPTDAARNNLKAEGVGPSTIWVTGDTVVDALLEIARTAIATETEELLGRAGALPDGSGNKVILVTAHRRKNFGRGLEEICNGITRVGAPSLRCCDHVPGAQELQCG